MESPLFQTLLSLFGVYGLTLEDNEFTRDVLHSSGEVHANLFIWGMVKLFDTIGSFHEIVTLVDNTFSVDASVSHVSTMRLLSAIRDTDGELTNYTLEITDAFRNLVHMRLLTPKTP